MSFFKKQLRCPQSKEIRQQADFHAAGRAGETRDVASLRVQAFLALRGWVRYTCYASSLIINH